MYDYQGVRRTHGHRVSQTVDSPILIADFWDLSDAFAGLFVILIFGILLNAWTLMLIGLSLCLGAAPVIKRRYNRGIFLHWPYRRLWISLPGVINPKGRRRYSD